MDRGGFCLGAKPKGYFGLAAKKEQGKVSPLRVSTRRRRFVVRRGLQIEGHEDPRDAVLGQEDPRGFGEPKLVTVLARPGGVFDLLAGDGRIGRGSHHLRRGDFPAAEVDGLPVRHRVPDGRVVHDRPDRHPDRLRLSWLPNDRHHDWLVVYCGDVLLLVVRPSLSGQFSEGLVDPIH
jgi:hypothetical protein